MSKKKKTSKVEADQFEAEQNLAPPSEQVTEETPEQPAASEASTMDAAAAAIEQIKDHAAPKKVNGFMSMLEEANARRKARIKKYQDAQNKQAGSTDGQASNS